MDTIKTIRNRAVVKMHRCPVCVKMLAQDGIYRCDNGFIPIDQPWRHEPSCPVGQKEQA